MNETIKKRIGWVIYILALAIMLPFIGRTLFPYSHVEGSWLKSKGFGPEAVTIKSHRDNVSIRNNDFMSWDVPADGMEHESSSERLTWYSVELKKDDLTVRRRALNRGLQASQSVSDGKLVTYIHDGYTQSISEDRWHSSDGKTMTYVNGGHTGEYVRPSLRFRLFRAVP
jgi:hypothetical protein